MPLKGTKTHENLKQSFASEAQANRRYLYFARRADIEGYPEIGGLFRDTAEAERDGMCSCSGNVAVTVRLTAASTQAVTVEYSTSNSTALYAEGTAHKIMRMIRAGGGRIEGALIRRIRCGRRRNRQRQDGR